MYDFTVFSVRRTRLAHVLHILNAFNIWRAILDLSLSILSIFAVSFHAPLVHYLIFSVRPHFWMTWISFIYARKWIQSISKSFTFSLLVEERTKIILFLLNNSRSWIRVNGFKGVTWNKNDFNMSNIGST